MTSAMWKKWVCFCMALAYNGSFSAPSISWSRISKGLSERNALQSTAKKWVRTVRPSGTRPYLNFTRWYWENCIITWALRLPSIKAEITFKGKTVIKNFQQKGQFPASPAQHAGNGYHKRSWLSNALCSKSEGLIGLNRDSVQSIQYGKWIISAHCFASWFCLGQFYYYDSTQKSKV